MLKSELEALVAAWIDGRISESESQTLQRELLSSSEARAYFRQVAHLDVALRRTAGGEVPMSDVGVSSPDDATVSLPASISGQGKFRFSRWSTLAIAASAMMAVATVAYWQGRQTQLAAEPTDPAAFEGIPSKEEGERTLAGYAILR
ncbi:hypothetical protein N9N28_18015, partial [Rubripirellula amarantea]|nr:hypothetical protein [Rubripirellula amarantea]